MTLLWQGTGGLFTRAGRIGYPAYLNNLQQPGFLAALGQVLLQYDSSQEDVIASLLASQQQYVRATSALMGFATGTAQATIQEMVAADNPVRGANFLSALNEVLRQMTVTGQTVARCTVSAGSTVQATNVGSGVVVLSTKRGDGLVQENLVAESALLICTADSFTGGATVGREVFQFVGVPQGAGTWDWDWPQGSAASVFLNAISASQYGSSSGNLLTNGDFEQWALPAAKNWTISPTAATWGVDFSQSNTPYQGTYCLQINPTGLAAAILQPFGNASAGTSPTLTAQRSYAVNLWMRSTSASGTPVGGLLLSVTKTGVPTTGTISVDLVDGFGTITSDQQGTANSFAINVATSGVSQSGIWLPFSGTFRLPQVMPAQAQLRIRESTPIAGAAVLIDSVAMTPLVATYSGGPGLALFSSSVPFLLNDAYTVQTTNNRAGAAYCSTFQSLFDRLFGMRQLNLLLPSSLTPTIPDSLVSGGGGTPWGGLLLTITRG